MLEPEQESADIMSHEWHSKDDNNQEAEHYSVKTNKGEVPPLSLIHQLEWT